MISLVLKKKLSLSEDALTAAFFDVMRQHQAMQLLRDVLSIARPAFEGGELPAAFDGFGVDLWPGFDKGQEADARVRLYCGETEVLRLLVESKTGAPKSAEGDLDDDGGGDQLATYLVQEALGHPGTPVSLLYLTHHAARPGEDLDDTRKALRDHPALVKELFWAPWRDVEAILGRAEPRTPCSEVRELLRRLKLYRFGGFDLSPTLGPFAGGWFYAQRPRAPHAYPNIGDRLDPLGQWHWLYEDSTPGQLFYRSTADILPAFSAFTWSYDQ